MKTFVCITCGNGFESRKASKNRTPKFCSKRCYGKSLKLNIRCQQCGEIIENNNSAAIKNRKYCSTACQADARKGKSLSPKWRTAVSEGRKSSEKCKGKNLYNWKGGAENRRMINSRRSHEKRANGKIDQIYLSILFVLQRGKCFYCNGDITNKGQKAIEHLKPVSRGGTNEWLNLVYSCKSCNSRKRDKSLFQFAMENLRPDWMNNMVQFLANDIRCKIKLKNV